jgi:hypothetical protein
MSFIYYMASHYIKPGPSCFKKRKYNPFYDEDEEAISDMVNEESDIDSDDEMDLEIVGETVSEEPSKKSQKVK